MCAIRAQPGPAQPSPAWANPHQPVQAITRQLNKFEEHSLTGYDNVVKSSNALHVETQPGQTPSSVATPTTHPHPGAWPTRRSLASAFLCFLKLKSLQKAVEP